jgi:capsular polysaccharide transport system permease protein
MAILTDFVSTQGTREYVRLCEGLAHYRYVMLDLQRFCDKRESEVEENRLVEELKSYGLSPTDHTIDLAEMGHYRLFESTGAEALRRVQAESRRGANVRPGRASMVVAPQPSMEVAVSVGSTEVVPQREQALPVESIEPSRALRGFSLPPLPSKARHSRFGGWLGLSALLTIGIPALLAIAYYGFIASNQYVTTLQFAVRGPSQAAAGRVIGAASLQGAGAMSPDSFVVTDYINSAQALADVEKVLDVRRMFSRADIDFWFRLRGDAPREQLIAYWARVVSARFDLISGNVLVNVHGFDPRDSLTLAETIVAKADEMFRRLNNQAQRDMVRLADESVAQAQVQLAAASRALVEFRQKSGLVDPTRTAQAGASIVDELRRQLATLQAQAATTKATAPNSPTLAGLNSQIKVIEGQIRKEEATLGPSLVQSVSAETLARYQSLEVERQSLERLYGEALSLRSQAYLIAQSQQSYLALFAAPSLPQASIYPNRLRAIITVIASAALAWFVGMLAAYAIRDHLM